ncbi:SemiSWEET transporter [Methylophilus sp. Leaf408]|jgi:MtN3 and saliva related transmembrane protein|uniref:SemiSWEET transporter n=1 Tax=Methylophilus sp. Leaf408 TaxID=2876561 RepID=UPI001E2A4A0A|nr:SemiSWEET transporter [Methylophilus sp. Leaf408]
MSLLNTCIGSIAAICTTVAFVPQVIKSWRTRDLSGISLPMYTIFTLGVILWLVYGLLIGDWPVIIANAITALLAGGVLLLKLQSLKMKSPKMKSMTQL